ncbi:sensor histidine kinase [Roseivirga sp.]|uniref:sensor histidine kinase n=1 Tax=Roseivirga sp. TaxID=1964215 RepID=UPI003B8DA37A
MKIKITITLLFVLCLNSMTAQDISVIDLRDWDGEEFYKLDGQWDFYWNQLIEKRSDSNVPPTQIEVPHDWSKIEINGVELPDFGYATYAVRLILPKEKPQSGMLITNAFSSYNVFVNDSLIYESGVVAKTKKEYRGYREPKVVSLKEFKSDTLDVIIQVSNYHHSNAGLYYSLEVGSWNKLIKELRTNQGLSLFLAGAFFITGFILIAFSAAYRHLSLPVPFYALFSLSMMYRLVGTDYYPLHAMLNTLNFDLAICLEYLSGYTASLFGGLFIFTLYPNQTNKWFKRIFLIVTIINIIIVLVTPSVFFTSILRYYLLFMILSGCVFLYTVIRAKIDREPTSSYLISALLVLVLWVFIQTIDFLNIYGNHFGLRALLLTIAVILANLALFKTFVMRMDMLTKSRAEMEYQKSRQTMLSLISHEIKMPVATLQMNMEMIKRSSEQPEKFAKVKDKIVDLSLSSVESIKRMLHDFIYFMTLNQKASDKVNFKELSDFVNENWSLEVISTPESNLGLRYATDKMTLKYIMNTLIGNAMKFSRQTDAPVEIHLNQKGSNLIIEVRDYGVGISEEQLKTLGTNQSKVDENQEITGMGFYLAKDLTERLGHKLWITSRGTDGTSVFISLKSI